MQKILKTPPLFLLILAAEKNRIDNGRNNIVKGVRPGGDAKAADSEKNCEINTCDCAKAELRPAKRGPLIQLAAEKIYMMMCAEKRRRNEHRKYDRVRMIKPEDVLEQYHQNAY